MPLHDRKQDAWPSIADLGVAPEPGRDQTHPPAGEYPPIAAVIGRFGAEGISIEEYGGQYRLIVPKAKLLEVMTFLKSGPALAFDYLIDVHGQDYLHFRGARDRFCVVYQLLSHAHNRRLWVKVLLNEPDLHLPSVQPLWKGADWLEREVYDMFGIVFDGHPDLRRVLMPKVFRDWPLRKDYPLTGKGERHDFLKVERTEA
jgi:NADH-quinone oxidoreductase subunit C